MSIRDGRPKGGQFRGNGKVVTDEQIAMLGKLAERLRLQGFNDTASGAEVDQDGNCILVVSGTRRGRPVEYSFKMAPGPGGFDSAHRLLEDAVDQAGMREARRR